MPQVSKLSQQEWSEVKDALVAGVSYRTISERYEIEEYVLRKRASREKWPVPNRVEEMAERYRAEGLIPKSQNVTKASQIASEELQGIRERHPLLLAPYLEKKLKTMVEQDLLPTPGNWKTASIAVSTQAKVLGLDKPAVNVSLAIGGMFRSPDQAGIVLEETTPTGYVGNLDEESTG